MAHHVTAHEPRDPADYTGADAQYFETPPGAGYEHTDASVGTIVKFAVWLLVSAVVVHVGVGLAYLLLIRQAMTTAPARFPLAMGQEAPLPPEPRLQQYPARDLTVFRSKEEAELHGYGWVNRDAAIVRIPIEDAMRMTLERGLPSRELAPGEVAATPGLLASDSSSGRVMERRRQ